MASGTSSTEELVEILAWQKERNSQLSAIVTQALLALSNHPDDVERKLRALGYFHMSPGDLVSSSRQAEAQAGILRYLYFIFGIQTTAGQTVFACGCRVPSLILADDDRSKYVRITEIPKAIRQFVGGDWNEPSDCGHGETPEGR